MSGHTGEIRYVNRCVKCFQYRSKDDPYCKYCGESLYDNVEPENPCQYCGDEHCCYCGERLVPFSVASQGLSIDGFEFGLFDKETGKRYDSNRHCGRDFYSFEICETGRFMVWHMALGGTKPITQDASLFELRIIPKAKQ